MRRFDSATIDLSRIARTPAGGYRIPAHPTGVGVFPYRQTDGTTRLEYRSPEEVFSSESLASLRAAPVTYLHPPVPVDASNWRSYSIGHVADNVAPDGSHVGAEFVISDEGAISKIAASGIREISCGYSCDLDETPGVTPGGQKYDARQVRIRYNHAAVGPQGWGRQGSTAALRLDATDASQVSPDDPPQPLAPPPEKRMKTIRIDGTDYEVGSDLHVAKIEAMAEARVAAEKARADAAETARKTALDSTAEAEKERTDALALVSPKAIQARVKARGIVEDAFRAACAVKRLHLDAETGEMDEATEGEMGDMDDSAIKAQVVAMVCPDLELTPETIPGAFAVAVKWLASQMGMSATGAGDGAAEGEGETRGPAMRGDSRDRTRAQRPAIRTDGADPKRAKSAGERMRADAAERWKTPVAK